MWIYQDRASGLTAQNTSPELRSAVENRSREQFGCSDRMQQAGLAAHPGRLQSSPEGGCLCAGWASWRRGLGPAKGQNPFTGGDVFLRPGNRDSVCVCVSVREILAP